jgi:hypothetical protein
MTYDPITLSALAMAFVFTMAFAGAKKHALEFKRQKRVCPSCGRRIEGRTCGEH